MLPSQRARGWGGVVGIAALLIAGRLPAAEDVARPAVSITEIAAGIERHIAQRSQADGGYLKVRYGRKELQLQLVRVHLEYLAYLGKGVSFACVDMVGTDGPVYDVDFFMKGQSGAMNVTATSVHKINGKPLYAWEQRRNGTWHKVPVKGASNALLGVIQGRDDFEFIYRAKLPELDGPAQIWLPLAKSDAFQTVTVESIRTPTPYRELHEARHGDTILWLKAGPAERGQTIEIVYRASRLEKSPYPAVEPNLDKYLHGDRLVPVTDEFRRTAEEVTRGKTTDLMRARAIYDHVIETIRYAKYGNGWGIGDAVYACDAKSGNCSDFHAYFIGLARAAGIPARFAIGAAIPSERNDGGIDGYHCWAEFYAAGKWFPVDLSEANKYSSLATYYFGHHPANRFELSQGRDLVVDPGPASGPINLLAYPVLEVRGKPASIKTEFLFRRLSGSGTTGRR